jgi:hypothetical protein
VALRLQRHGTVLTRSSRVVARRAAISLRPQRRLHRGRYVLVVKAGSNVVSRISIHV